MEFHKKVKTIILKSDFISIEETPTEFVQLLIVVDSNGKIRNLHPMGIDTSSFYKAFKTIKTEYFEDWICIDCRNKLIVIPYFYLSINPGKKNFLDNLFTEYYLKIPLKNLITVTENVITIKWLSITKDERSVSRMSD